MSWLSAVLRMDRPGGLCSRVLQPTGLEASLTKSGRSRALCALMAHLVATAAGNRSSICYPILYPIPRAGDIFILVSEIGNFRVLSGEIKITHEDSASPVSAVPCSLGYPSVNASFCLYAGAGFRDEQLMKANHRKYCSPFWASCTWAEKKGVGYGSFGVTR